MLLEDKAERIGNSPQANIAAIPRCRANSTRGTTELANASYTPVESVRRALALLKALNDLRFASVGDLYRATDISKPTIVRMLETLISEGYVARDDFSGGYRVTSNVQSLSSGFDGTPLLIEAAHRWTVELTRSTKWPVSLGTASDGDIFVNFTTSSISPWAYPFAVLHTRLRMLTTAMGRSYLAFCPDDEREMIMHMQFGKYDRDETTEEIARIRRAIDGIRSNGYAHPDLHHTAKQFQFIAVPITDQGRCIASMGMGFYRRAVPIDEIAEKIYAPMRATALKIEQDIRNVRECMVDGAPSH